MSKLAHVADLVLLSEAAYGDFIEGGKLLSDVDGINKALIKEDTADMAGEFQAKLVTDNWIIADHWDDKAEGLFDKESGFSGTLFQSQQDGHYVLGLKGTAGNKDLIGADVQDIVSDGFATILKIIRVASLLAALITPVTYLSKLLGTIRLAAAMQLKLLWA